MAAAGLLAVAACGGAPAPSAECNRYMACVTKLAGTAASLESKYGASGTCWEETSAAEQCTRYCKSGLDSLLSGFPGDAGC